MEQFSICWQLQHLTFFDGVFRRITLLCARLTQFQSVSVKDFVEFMFFWKMLFD